MLAPWFCFGPCSNNELRLSCFHSIESLDLFEEFLSQRGPWVGGFDLPFSMPRDLIEHFDWPSVGIFLQNFIAPRQKSYQEIFY